MVSRTDRSAFAEWWWTVDKVLLGSFVVLMMGGVVLSLAGSPAVAERLGYDSFHFFWRHLFFFGPALAVLIAASLLSTRFVRRAALVVLGIALVLMVATLFIGYEINGARRWISRPVGWPIAETYGFSIAANVRAVGLDLPDFAGPMAE